MAKTWGEISQLPEFQNLSREEQERARGLFFDTKIAPQVDPEALPKARSLYDEKTLERTWGEAATDTGKQLLEGGVNIINAIPSLVAPDWAGTKALDAAAQGLQDWQSPTIKAKIANANRAIDEAGKEGLTSQAGEALSQYWHDPALASRLVATNIASIIPGLGSAKLAQGASLARSAKAAGVAVDALGAAEKAKAAKMALLAGGITNSALNAGGARGEAYKDLYDTALQQGYTEEEANQIALDKSLLPAAVGGVTGAVSGGTGLESGLFGRIAGKSALREGVKHFGTEVAGELSEEALPQVATNWQASQYDQRPLTKDLGRTLVETALATGPNATAAGVAGALRHNQPQEDPGTNPDSPTVEGEFIPGSSTVELPSASPVQATPTIDIPVVGPLSEAAKAGQEASAAGAQPLPTSPAVDPAIVQQGAEKASAQQQQQEAERQHAEQMRALKLRQEQLRVNQQEQKLGLGPTQFDEPSLLRQADSLAEQIKPTVDQQTAEIDTTTTTPQTPLETIDGLQTQTQSPVQASDAAPAPGAIDSSGATVGAPELQGQPRTPTSTPVLEDQQHVDALNLTNEAINSQGGERLARPRVRLATPKDLHTSGRVARRLASAIASGFGHRVIYVASENPQETLTFDGAISPKDPTTIFLAHDSGSPVNRVVSHEVLHGLRRLAPDVYTNMVSGLRQIYDPQSVAQHAEQRGYLGGLTDANEEEWVADLFSNTLHTPKGLAQLALAMDKKILGSGLMFLNNVKAFISALHGRLLGSPEMQGADKALSDLEQARDIVAQGISHYARYRLTGKKSEDLGTVPLSLRSSPAAYPKKTQDLTPITPPTGEQLRAMSPEDYATIPARHLVKVKAEDKVGLSQEQSAAFRAAHKKATVAIASQQESTDKAHQAWMQKRSKYWKSALTAEELESANRYAHPSRKHVTEYNPNVEREVRSTLDVSRVTLTPQEKAIVAEKSAQYATSSEEISLVELKKRQKQLVADSQQLKAIATEKKNLPSLSSLPKEERAQARSVRAEIEVRRKALVAGIAETKSYLKKAEWTRSALSDQITSRIKEIRATFPPSQGWRSIAVIDATIKNDNGSPQVELKWQPIPYSFEKTAELTQDQWSDQMADIVVQEVVNVIKRAHKGRENPTAEQQTARVILASANWYRKMVHRLRAEFGGFADVFADLLGSTSPNTSVDTNWTFAVQALKGFVRGEYDNQLQALDDWLKAGKSVNAFKSSHPDLLISRSSGMRFGMNSDKAMKAMLGLWRAIKSGDAPKARNFSLNLIGQSEKATIDVWAARFLQRISGQKRIPFPAEHWVTGSHLVNPENVGGAFGFGQEVFRKASDTLKGMGFSLTPADLQAVVWFLEKELWTKKDYTNKRGEGGSFEALIAKMAPENWQFGYTINRDSPPSDQAMATEAKRITKVFGSEDGVELFRVTPTQGLFAGDPERSFDMEAVTSPDWKPGRVISYLAEGARATQQYDIFISRKLGEDELHPNARPGLEIAFKRDLTREELDPILQTLMTNGVDGFTVTVNPIHARTLQPGQEGKQFSGIRLQYVPEITQRAVRLGWATDQASLDEANELASGDQNRIDAVLKYRSETIHNAADSVVDNPLVAHSKAYKYDTLVIGTENYGDYVGHAAKGDSAFGKGAAGESIVTRLQGSTSRIFGRPGTERFPSVALGEPGSSGIANAPLSLRSDAGGQERTRGRPATQGIPSYGKATPGSVQGIGVHFSRGERSSLDSSKFGTGIKGREAARVAAATDPRLKNRVYFYINGGKGIHPEQGLGGYAHTVNLQNLYDLDADPKYLAKQDANATESAILEAGYDGYVADFGAQRAAVLLGQRQVPVRYEGASSQVQGTPPMKRLTPNPIKQVAEALKSPWQKRTPAAFGALLKEKSPELYAQFGDQLTDTEQTYWPGDMARRLVPPDTVDATPADIAAWSRAVPMSIRTDPPPKKTVVAYKLFRLDHKRPGLLFPLFVKMAGDKGIEMGIWLDAEEGARDKDKGDKVSSSIGPLAYRPGWHAGDLPIATHIGAELVRRFNELTGKFKNLPTVRRPTQVWAEVELAADEDWQSVANSRALRYASDSKTTGAKKGDIRPETAQITDQIPVNGFYRYKTNSNMTGNWLIGGSMKVNRLLSDAEVKRINGAAGTADLPRKEPLDLKKFGFADGPKFSNRSGLFLDPQRIDYEREARREGSDADRELVQSRLDSAVEEMGIEYPQKFSVMSEAGPHFGLNLWRPGDAISTTKQGINNALSKGRGGSTLFGQYAYPLYESEAAYLQRAGLRPFFADGGWWYDTVSTINGAYAGHGGIKGLPQDVRNILRRVDRRTPDVWEVEHMPLPRTDTEYPVRKSGSTRFSNRPASPPEETRFRKAQRVVQDKFNRFRVVQDWLRAQGITLSESADVYRAEERLHARVANKIEDFRDQELKSLVKKTQQAKVSMDDVAQFLHAQHAEERNDAVAKINPNFPDGGSGMTTSVARSILSRATPELRAIANEWRDITEKSLQMKVDSGLITQEMADAYHNKYQHYVPLKGGPEDQLIAGTGRGLKVRHREKRALGHPLRDGGEWIIEQILADRESTIMKAEKALVAKHLLQMAIEINRPDIISVEKPKLRQVLREKHAYVVTFHGSPVGSFQSLEAARVFRQFSGSQKGRSLLDFDIVRSSDPQVVLMASPMLGDNETMAYIAGHEIRMQINDDLLARAYGNLGQEALGPILRAGRALNTYLSKAYTGYNPEFILTNMIRDFTTGIANLTGEQGLRIAGKAVKHYPQAFMDLLRSTRGVGHVSKAIQNYREDGGNTGAAYLDDLERLGTNIQDEYAKLQGVVKNVHDRNFKGAARAAIGKTLKPFIGWIEKLNQASENAMRLAIYQAMIEAGKGRVAAASAAKNTTVNFNRKGEMGQAINAWWLFFNASVQGTAAIAHAHFKGEHKGQAWGISSTLVGTAYLASLAAASGGDDDKDRYEKLSDYERSRNLIIRTGNGFVKIPIPYGYGFMWNMGRTMADAQRTGRLDKAPWHLAANFAEEFTPFGSMVAGAQADSKQAVMFMGPTAWQALAVPAFNLTSFGTPLYPEKSFQTAEFARDQMWRGTKGTWSDELAGVLEKAGMDVSPETLKHLWRTGTGGAGSFVSSIADLGQMGARGVTDFDAKEIPFVRKLWVVPDVRDARARYYAAVEETKVAKETFKRFKSKGDFEKADTYQSENEALISLAALADSTSQRIKRARDLYDSVKLNQDMTLPEKRQALRDMEIEETQIYDDFVRTFNERTR